MRAVIIITLVIVGIIIGPALLVWSTNELLEQAGVVNQIDFNFWSWLAGVVFLACVRGASSSSSSS